MSELDQSEGYLKLRAAVDKDKSEGSFHDYEAKFLWVIERVRHYAERTGIADSAILDAWEKSRDYWYMNYYQDANQPLLTDASVRVFDTKEDLRDSVGDSGFRCPRCNGVSRDPHRCDSGLLMDGKEVCNWKSYGLFRTLGKGAFAFVKSEMRGENLFFPVAWESSNATTQTPTPPGG